MRVAFCGASGTGKTTLARFLANRMGWPMTDMGSRTVAKELGFDSPYDVDKASLREYRACIGDELPVERAAKQSMMHFTAGERTMRVHFQHRLQEAKIAWEMGKHDLVTDRTTVDDFVYCAIHNIHGITETFTDRARTWTSSYDLIVFCGMDEYYNHEGDKARVNSEWYHRTFELFCDGVLVNWLGDDWNERVKYIEGPNLLVRQEQVLKMVRDRKDFLERIENKG